MLGACAVVFALGIVVDGPVRFVTGIFDAMHFSSYYDRLDFILCIFSRDE